uniref:Cation-transporting ATPase n=1 Tax=Caenorhabditis japonica TaxID=281687 RepID=A0A8R1DVA3_CAEJA
MAVSIVKNSVYNTANEDTSMGKIKDEPGPKTAFNKTILNVGEETCALYAFKETPSRLFLFWFLTIVTVGFYRLFAYWMKSLEIAIRFEETGHEDADYVMVHDNHGIKTIKKVTNKESVKGFIRPTRSGAPEKIHSMRFFTYRKIKYIWYDKEQAWINAAELDSTAPFIIFKNDVDDRKGLTEEEVLSKREIYNRNSLIIKLTPLIVILFKEVLGPFYLFQVFSVTLWFIDQYAYYASVIVLITVLSAGLAVWEMRKQEKRIREMVGESPKVTLIRNGNDIEVDATEIVPGDIISLPAHSFVLPCDCLLMNGTVIVNEAMLTGESVPVTKASLKEADDCGYELRLSPERHNRHTLFSGTTILQTRNYRGQPVLARVLRTGFSTLKGQLVRSILYPKPPDPQQVMDVYNFIVVLASIALCGFGYTIAMMVYREESAKHIVVRSLDIITIVVPPALPAAMAVGTINANMRLKEKKIFCISPSTINTCGLINVACFDKTGTLTEDGLDFNCLKAIKKNEEGKPMFTKEFEDLDPEKLDEESADLNIVIAAASCHSLTRIDGILHGDPLEMILVEKSKWTLEEPVNSDEETMDFDNVQPTVLRPPPEQARFHPEDHEYSVIKQHPFNSALQRMSVIVSTPSEHSAHKMIVFTKGSPEMVASLCVPESIPKDYSDVVDMYAQRGFRLIAVAAKSVHMNFAKALKAPRDTMESDLEFLGLIVMENRLKDVTLETINKLSVANIRCVMVTGDNLLTAMSVARECGIIRPTKKAYLITHSKEEKDSLGRTKLFIKESVSSSENEIDTNSEVREFDQKTDVLKSRYQFAVAGPTYAVIAHEYPELMDRLSAVCDVYARMAPDQKAQMICALQSIGAKVSMCGDGANDCAALKTANAGISLSQAEASIAAPFTSNIADIRCVVEVILEGRCAVVTSYAVSKYMAAYSLNEFLSVMLLYWEGTNISDGQFLYIDFVLITIVALTLGNTAAAKNLRKIPPPPRLATLGFYFSVFGQLAINIVTQVAGFLLTRAQQWYIPNPEELDNHQTMIGTAVFFTSCCMYLGYAFVYSKGHPFRRPVYTNWLMCITIFIIFLVNLFFIFTNVPFFVDLMEFVHIPKLWFCFVLFAIGMVGVFISLLYEHYFVDKIVNVAFESYLRHRRIRKDDPTLPAYERMLASIGSSPSWFEKELAMAKLTDRRDTMESSF